MRWWIGWESWGYWKGKTNNELSNAVSFGQAGPSMKSIWNVVWSDKTVDKKGAKLVPNKIFGWGTIKWRCSSQCLPFFWLIMILRLAMGSIHIWRQGENLYYRANGFCGYIRYINFFLPELILTMTSFKIQGCNKWRGATLLNYYHPQHLPDRKISKKSLWYLTSNTYIEHKSRKH